MCGFYIDCNDVERRILAQTPKEKYKAIQRTEQRSRKMFFSGKVKERVVSAGGKKRDAERKDFLEQTRKQREERAQDRFRSSSANIIQKIYRGFCSRKSNHSSLLLQFDKKISDVRKLESIFASKGSVFLIPIDTILTLISIYCHCFREPVLPEETRLAALLGIVCDSFSRASPHNYLLPIVSATNTRVSWQCLLSMLLRVTLKSNIYFRCNAILNTLIAVHNHDPAIMRLLAVESTHNIERGSESVGVQTQSTSSQMTVVGIFRFIFPQMSIFIRDLYIKMNTNYSGHISGKSDSEYFFNSLVSAVVIGLSIQLSHDTAAKTRMFGHSANCVRAAWTALALDILTLPQLANLVQSAGPGGSAGEPSPLAALIHALNSNNASGWNNALQCTDLDSLSSLYKTRQQDKIEKSRCVPKSPTPVQGDQTTRDAFMMPKKTPRVASTRPFRGELPVIIGTAANVTQAHSQYSAMKFSKLGTKANQEQSLSAISALSTKECQQKKECQQIRLYILGNFVQCALKRSCLSSVGPCEGYVHMYVNG